MPFSDSVPHFIWAGSGSMSAAPDLETLLLLVAFRNRICEPDYESGLLRFVELIERNVDPEDLALCWRMR